MSKYDKEKWVTADFETTTEKFYNEYGFVKVWLYAISDSDGKILKYGDSIEDFMKYCKENLNGYIVYFHNLKFDGSYILNYLINKEIPYKDKIFAKDSKCYNTLISDDGNFYQITYHPHQSCTIKFQDSLKLLPFSIKKIAEDFNLPIKKGTIDYDKYEITEETLGYIFNDVSIAAMALKELKNIGMTQMTTASCAYNNFSNDFPFMNDMFPILETEFLEKYRLAYRGGRCQVNPLYASKTIYNVKRYDINSMYPHIMRNLPLPVGNPIPINKMGNYKFELYELDIKFKLKEGHLPSLLKKDMIFGEGSYYIETEDIETICISSIDFEILQRHYDIEFMYIREMYGFKTREGLFSKYIDKWYKIKQENKGAKRVIAKLMLNSLYGKFGSRCKGKSKIPKLDENGVLTFDLSEEQDMRKYYLPIAIAITSYAHLLIDNAIINTGIINFVYCDTDSVHTLSKLDNELVDQYELGKFKLEGTELKSKYVRQKTYCYSEIDKENDIVYTIVCAGMNDATKEYILNTYEDSIFEIFDKGLKVENTKMMPKQVKGGVVLLPTSFEIK